MKVNIRGSDIPRKFTHTLCSTSNLEVWMRMMRREK